MKLIAIVSMLSCCAALAATEEQINKNFTSDPGGKIIVDVDFGAIEIASNATDEVTIDVWRKISRKNKADEAEFLRAHPVNISQDGTTVIIRCRHTEEKSGWSGWFSGNRNEAKYTIHVPAQSSADLNTSGGGISISDLTGSFKANTSGGGLKFSRLHGPLKGDTSGGGIRVSDCEGEIKIDTSGGGIDVSGGGGSLNGDTSGGGVAVRNFRGPTAVNTSGGGITIENVAGKINGHTSGGSINAALISPLPGDVALSTSGGGVTVKAPENAAFNLDAETFAGGVSCDLPITIQGKKEHGKMKGAVNGGGPTVKLESSGGGIHVKKL